MASSELKIRALQGIVMVALCGGGGNAIAAGFALVEHGASGLGNAFAGAGAVAEDPSTIWFNPAGMALLPGTRIAAAGHLIVPRIDFENQGSRLSPLVGNGPIVGGNGGDAGELAAAPSLYYKQPVGERGHFGLGINAPFGLTTEYNDDWVGRYHALKSELLTVNINPNFAYKINDAITVSAGVNALYADAELSSAIDQSAICLGLLGAACAGLGLDTPGNQATDGEVAIEADDWGYGYNLGALFTLSDRLRVGAAYRSEIEIEAQGEADFNDINPGFTATGLFTDTGAAAEIDLPSSFSLSALYDISQHWSLLGDVTWTEWSRFQELRIEFDNPNQPDSVTTEAWEDTFRYSFGARYQPDPAWSYRLGAAYDETPVPSAQLRTPRLPDEDRLWLAVGASYSPTARLRVDIGYAHVFIDDAGIENTLESEIPTTSHTLRGEYEGEIDILSA